MQVKVCDVCGMPVKDIQPTEQDTYSWDYYKKLKDAVETFNEIRDSTPACYKPPILNTKVETNEFIYNHNGDLCSICIKQLAGIIALWEIKRQKEVRKLVAKQIGGSNGTTETKK